MCLKKKVGVKALEYNVNWQNLQSVHGRWLASEGNFPSGFGWCRRTIHNDVDIGNAISIPIMEAVNVMVIFLAQLLVSETEFASSTTTAPSLSTNTFPPRT